MPKKTTLYIGINLLQQIPFKHGDKILTLKLTNAKVGMLGAFPVFKKKKDAQKALGKEGKIVAIPVTLRK